MSVPSETDRYGFRDLARGGRPGYSDLCLSKQPLSRGGEAMVPWHGCRSWSGSEEAVLRLQWLRKQHGRLRRSSQRLQDLGRRGVTALPLVRKGRTKNEGPDRSTQGWRTPLPRLRSRTQLRVGPPSHGHTCIQTPVPTPGKP